MVVTAIMGPYTIASALPDTAPPAWGTSPVGSPLDRVPPPLCGLHGIRQRRGGIRNVDSRPRRWAGV